MSRSLPGITWTIVFLYVATIFLRPTGLIPENLNAPLGALLALAFAVIHGSRQYGWRGMLTFAVICLVVSNAFENASILTASRSAIITTATNSGRSSFSFRC